MRPARSLLAAVKRALPGLTRREWGELAIAAARRAGLKRDDIFRLSLAIQLRAIARAGATPGPAARRRVLRSQRGAA